MEGFDGILKENLEALYLPLAAKYLGIHIREVTDLPEKIQTTLAREPYFLKLVLDEFGKEYILHIEFQSQDALKWNFE